jgi:hypothetical protein
LPGGRNGNDANDLGGYPMNRLRGMMLGLVDQTAGGHSHVAGGFEGSMVSWSTLSMVPLP